MNGAVQSATDARDGVAAHFWREGHRLLPKLIEPALAEFLWSYVHTKFASMQMSSGDPQVPNTPSGYGDSAFDGLLEYLRPRIEAASGRRLHPTYSYFRLYKKADVLKRHRDRPACEISVSLNIGQWPSDPWPLHIEGASGPHAAQLFPGDALLYLGCRCRHWRKRYEGERLAQVFLHYVDADGPHADQRFDKRASLMRPAAGKAARSDQAAEP